MYLSWAAVYEGASDKSYYDVLLPRIIEDISLSEGVRPINVPSSPAVLLGQSGRGLAAVAEEVCKFKDALHLVFIHADTGGRNLEAAIETRTTGYCTALNQLCDWDLDRCVILTPRHETEAWALSDPDAVAAALGYAGPLDRLGLPQNAAVAERLINPKSVLAAAAELVSGRRARRNGSQLFTAIAQQQNISLLRGSASFRDFENRLRRSLFSLGCISAV